jgi:hypothetical protein
MSLTHETPNAAIVRSLTRHAAIPPFDDRHDNAPSFDDDGTYGEEMGASATSVMSRTQSSASVKLASCTTAICDSGDNNTTARPNLFPAHALLRAQRLRDLLAAIAEWARASGPDRAWWRRLYAQPERAAFLAAVARSQHKEHAT